MGLVLRQNLDRRLTIAEMDGNFSYLQTLAINGTASGGIGYTFSKNTYDNWYTQTQNGTLPIGQFIEITDRADNGILLYCSATNSFALEGTGCFINADYQAIGNYSAIDGFLDQVGIWSTSSEIGYVNGYVSIWNNNHYLVTDASEINGDSPDDNPSAYFYLSEEFGNGYIQEWDVIIYDFLNDNLKWRMDKRGNKISLWNSEFQWGDNNIMSVQMSTYESYITIINNTGTILGGQSGQYSTVYISGNSNYINYSVSGEYSYLLSYYNSGNIDVHIDGSSIAFYSNVNSAIITAHLEGYSAGLFPSYNSGNIQVYIYDNSSVEMNYNTGLIYARYNDNCGVNHDYNAGSIYYVEFKSFGVNLGNGYFDQFINVSLNEDEVFSYSTYKITTARLLYLQENSLLIPGITYEIIDNAGPATTYGMISLSQSQYNIDNYVRLKAISNIAPGQSFTTNLFEKYGERNWYVPIAYSAEGNIGLPTFGTFSGFTYSVLGNIVNFNQDDATGAAVIWGGWIWVNTTGTWGGPSGSLTTGSGQISLDNNWTLVNKNSGGDGYDDIRNAYYKEEISQVIWNKGRIEWIKDSFDNELDVVLFLEGYYNDCVLPQLCSVDFFQFAQEGIYANKNQLILNNFLDGSPGNIIYIITNGDYGLSASNAENNQIYDNTGNFGLIWNNILINGGVISGNQLYPYSYIQNNILIDTYFNGNTIQNWSGFSNNFTIETDISGNFLFNSSFFSYIEFNDNFTSVNNCQPGFSIVNSTLDNSSINNFNNVINSCIFENSYLENMNGALNNCSVNGLGTSINYFNFNNLTTNWSNRNYTPYASTFDYTIDQTYLSSSIFTNNSALYDLAIPAQLSHIGIFLTNFDQSYNILRIIGTTDSLPIKIEPTNNRYFNLYSLPDATILNDATLALSFYTTLSSDGIAPIYVTDSIASYMMYPIQYWSNSGVGSYIQLQRHTNNLSINRVINYGGWTTQPLPTVILEYISDGSQTIELVVGNVTNQGLSPVTDTGIAYGTIDPPTINMHMVSSGASGSGTFSVSGVGVYSYGGQIIYIAPYATNEWGTSYGAVTSMYVEPCLAEGTKISLSNGILKNIEDINYSDILMTWNFDEGKFDKAKPLWIKKSQSTKYYNLLKFSDGTELKTIGQHRIFNKEKGMFTYPMTEDTKIGTTTFNSFGKEITLIGKELIKENINYYNIITNKDINLFANGILASCRFSNVYPIENMKYIKDNRVIRDRSEFVNIPEKYIDGLRLCEQSYTLEQIETSVKMYEESKIEKEIYNLI